MNVSLARLYLTLWDPMDCIPPGSSVHRIFQARRLDWVLITLLQGILSNQGSNPGLTHCGQTLYHLSHQGSSNTQVLGKMPAALLKYQMFLF